MGEVLLGWGGRTILRSGYRGVVTPWEGEDVRVRVGWLCSARPRRAGPSALRTADGRFEEGWARRPSPSNPTRRARMRPAPLRQNKKGPDGALFVLAERVGFEPTVRSPVRLISSQVHSTTLPPLLVTIIMRSFRVRPHYRRRVRESQGLSAAAVHFAGRPAITASNVCRSRIRFVLRSKMPSVTPTSQ